MSTTMQNRTTLSALSTEELTRLAQTYPWWSAVKMELDSRGEQTTESMLYAARMRQRLRPLGTQLKSVDTSELQRSATLGIIDDFLRTEDHRIVIDDSTTDTFPTPTTTEDDDEEEFLSEELAEIYAKQHLFDLAIEIYEKLSLQDSQKSIYFAELIEALKVQQAEENNKK